jgi:TRAP-type C4-dicarboxylate transport system permease small subunit
VQFLLKTTERLALIVLMIGGLGMLMSMFLGVADVVGTQMLNVPVPGPRELTESTMVLIVFGALTYAQIRRAHIRVEIAYLYVGPKMQAVMDVVTDIAAIIFFSLLMWQGLLEAQYSLQIGEATSGLIRFPLWPARFTLVAGTGLITLRLILDAIVDMGRIKSGKPLAELKLESNV